MSIICQDCGAELIPEDYDLEEPKRKTALCSECWDKMARKANLEDTTKTRLFREDERVAGVYDICEWWFEHYPAEYPRFTNEGKLINRIRLDMRSLFQNRRRAKPSLKSEHPLNHCGKCGKFNKNCECEY